MSEQLITADDLAEAMLSADPPVVLDVRWQLGDPDGHAQYSAGHLPGAVYVDLDAELAGPPSATDGRHPLPALADLQAAARRWGIDDGSRVVVYDDIGNLASARCWWLLRSAGVADVRILDGGLGAWRAAGFRVSAGDATPRAGKATFTALELPTVDADEVASAAAGSEVIVLDARAAERYRGEVEPVDPRAGHIPGALSAPTTANVDDAGRFLPAGVLRERFSALGVQAGNPPIVYCGSGVNAAHQLVALAIAGFDGVLYPGSWSQWSSDPERPAATGA